MSRASDRIIARDAMALAHIKAAEGPCTQRDVRAHLLAEGSFAGSTSANSWETSTRASIKRLEDAGLVEVTGKTGLAILYSAVITARAEGTR